MGKVEGGRTVKETTSQTSSCGRLSVIIPTLGSVEDLRTLLAAVESELGPGDEILVVQARDSVRGSTEPLIATPPLRVVAAPRGRGRQLDCGAAMARGELLFFLHSDCSVPAGFAASIRRVCSDPRVSLGCFRLGFSPCNRALAWVARWANLRTRWFGLPYGDQGFFCRRSTWERVGGFHLPFLMEDLRFVRRCKSLGSIHLLQETMHTSPRRYLEHGILKASMLNHLMVFGYILGIDNRLLYRWYYGNRWGSSRDALKG